MSVFFWCWKQNSEEGQRRRGSYNVHHYDRNEWELKHTIKVSQVLYFEGSITF